MPTKIDTRSSYKRVHVDPLGLPVSLADLEKPGKERVIVREQSIRPIGEYIAQLQC